MTIRSDFSPIRPTTPPPEEKKLTDQELDAILIEAFGEMELNDNTTAPMPPPVLPMPKQLPKTVLETLLMRANAGEITLADFVQQLYAKGESGEISQEETMEYVLTQMESGGIDLGALQPSRELGPKEVRWGVEVFKRDPKGFEMLARMEILSQQEPKEGEAIAPLPDGRMARIFTLSLTSEENNHLEWMHTKEARAMGADHFMSFINKLVKEGKAAYVEIEGGFDAEEKVIIRRDLSRLGIKERDVNAMINHPDLRIALYIVPAAVLSRNEKLIAPFSDFIEKSDKAMEDPFFEFIETLSLTEKTLCKDQCVQYLNIRLNV